MPVFQFLAWRPTQRNCVWKGGNRWPIELDPFISKSCCLSQLLLIPAGEACAIHSPLIPHLCALFLSLRSCQWLLLICHPNQHLVIPERTRSDCYKPYLRAGSKNVIYLNSVFPLQDRGPLAYLGTMHATTKPDVCALLNKHVQGKWYAASLFIQ